MSQDPKVVCQVRTTLGSSKSRQARAQGLIPGNIYGHKQDPVAVTLASETLVPIIMSGHKVVDLEMNGQTEKAIVHAVQWDVLGSEILHFDLLRVDATERVTVNVPLLMKGTAPGVAAGGILEVPHHSIPVECNAISIPDNIVVKVADLEIGQAIHISDMEFPAGVTPKLPANEVVIHVVKPKAAAADELPTPVAAATPAATPAT